MAVPLNTALPWQQLQSQANAFQGAGQSPQAAMAGLGPQYAQAYQGALGLNAAVYEGGQTGYQDLRNSVGQQYQDIYQGYTNVYGDVLGRIAGSNASNIDDINTAATAQSGRASQEMVSRGLGNSTVQQNMQRAISLDRARAQTDSENKFAQLGAGYASSIGQNFLGAQERGSAAQADLGQAQLAQLERVNVPYPDPGMYLNLAQMYGQGQQAQRDDRSAFEKLGMTFGGGGNSTVGPSPGFAPRPSSFDYSGSGSSGGGGGSYGGGFGGGGFGGYSPQAPYQPDPALGFSGGNYGDNWGSPEAANQGSGEGSGYADEYGNYYPGNSYEYQGDY